MRITWLQPWFHRRQERCAPRLAVARGRWPFTRHNQPALASTSSALNQPDFEPQEPPPRRVMLSLSHHLDVARATQCLQSQLNCDGWHVACRHDHQLVVRLTREGAAIYGISYECSPAIEKAIYHGSRAWALTIIPLHGNDNLPSQKVMEIKAGLSELHG